MRAILFHAKRFQAEFHSLANRPKNIVHEEIKGKEKQKAKDCIVAFITVEQQDEEEKILGICKEIEKMCEEVKESKIVICPFAHLSNKLAEPKKGLKIIKNIENALEKKLEVQSAHFGSNKSLLLEIYGHAGNVRYREF